MPRRKKMPTPAEIREWCLYFQSTWTPKEEQERAGSGARVRAALREVRVTDFDPSVADGTRNEG
ncbi:MAG TPA: hypothetical protein VMR25_12755 [Planctomycetaceae bacterium]|jgi:hypothetical protein|nr:hypothetical protein [Planctomycetaceae bacterium]